MSEERVERSSLGLIDDLFDLVARGADAEARLAEGDVEAALDYAAANVVLKDRHITRPYSQLRSLGDEVEPSPRIHLKKAAADVKIPWEEVERALDNGTLASTVSYEEWDRFRQRRAAALLRPELEAVVHQVLRAHGAHLDSGVVSEIARSCAVRSADMTITPTLDS